MATGELSAQRLRELFHYDPETGVLTRTRRASSNAPAGAITSCLNAAGYVQVTVDGTRYYGHRLAWLYMTGEWPKLHIDHMNGNRSDNRFSNLRDVSRSCNLQNQRCARVNATSGFMGVWWDRKLKKWRTSIDVDGKQRYLGTFVTPEAAHDAYLTAKRKYHVGCTL